MLKFQVFNQGRAATEWTLRNAYLVSADSNQSPIRAQITFEDGLIWCEKREIGTAALCLQHPVDDCGELTLQTCQLPEREEPYLLSMELARHRIMLLYTKMEDWMLFDLGSDHVVIRRAEEARELLIAAVSTQKNDPAEASALAERALAIAVDGTEEMALAHAELLLNRRRATSALPPNLIGCGVALSQTDDRTRTALATNFDFLMLPMPWRLMEPEEGGYNWGPIDNWVDWARRNQLPLTAGPLVNFTPTVLPDWIYIWEQDYDTVRDLLYEHLERVVTRYRDYVTAWNVVSGLHVNHHFPFNFEQLMDLTRMATMLVRKLHPPGRILVEIRQPFGEYYATNQRSIPPSMYADLIVQGGIDFDSLSLQLLMGQAVTGQYTRDLMQISNLLDHFGGFGKSLHVTIAAPSQPVTQVMIATPEDEQLVDPNCGHWRKPWSPQVQSHWLEALFQLIISRPFVESIAWHQLMDHPAIELPLSGLVSEDFQAKNAFRRLVTFRTQLKQTPKHTGRNEKLADQPISTQE